MALLGLATTGCTRSAAIATTRQTPSIAVTTATPRQAVWPITMEAPGPVAAWQEASIGTQIGSYQLLDVRVNVGDQVRRGQVLATLDPALLKADEAQLAATYDQAEANRKRDLALQSSGAISDQDILGAVTTAKTAAANLASKRLQLKYTVIVAPDDGVISSRTATLGAVEPAGQELFKLIRQNRLEWRGEVTATQLLQVRPGQPVSLTLPNGARASAVVREAAPSLDSTSRLGVVYADLASGGQARAGMYANASLVLGRSAALLVPAASVIVRDGRSCVLKLLDSSATPRVALLQVTVGRRSDREVEVLSGVALTDRLVVQGAGFLNDGDIVRVAGSAITPSSAPASAQG